MAIAKSKMTEIAEEKKNCEIDLSPFGIIGLETLLPLCVRTLIEPGHLTWPELIAKLTVNPSRILGLEKTTRYYQASTSELFGKVQEVPQTEKTPFYPRSPYGVAKLYAYWICINYREAYGMHASNGILFNHEGPLRGETFVTRKITRAASAIKCGKQECLYLGNLNAKRDWGDARDFVRGMWMITQSDTPGDWVLATGKTRSIREFAEAAFGELGIDLQWEGEDEDEVAIDKSSGKTVIRIDPLYFRPTEVELLVGDYSKAKRDFGWEPEISFEKMVSDMVSRDLLLAQQEQVSAIIS